MSTPNYSVVCAHLRAAKAELERHPSKFATATCGEHLRKALLILADYEAHQEHHPEEARDVVEHAKRTTPKKRAVPNASNNEEPSK